MAIDPGVINLAYCILEWDDPAPAGTLGDLGRALHEGRLRIVEWAVLPVAPGGRRGAIAVVLEGVVAFLRARVAVFATLERVVIEQQMNACMKQVTACLYGGLRALCPHVAVAQQSAGRKLAFGDLAAFAPADASSGSVPLATYAQRKRAAVAAVARLLEAGPALPLATFGASRKKDDLADALLHGLAACAAPAPRGRKRAAPAGGA